MKKKLIQTSLFLIAASLLIAAGPEAQPAAAERTTASGLKITEVSSQPDAGAAKAGDMVWVHYTGKLQSTGAEFDSSRTRGEPISFQLGAGRVIKGWDEGLVGMKIGDKRILVIPPNLAYGPAGTPGGPIPPNATLVFDVELMGLMRK